MIDQNELNILIEKALKEDCPKTDVTVECILTKNTLVTAEITSKETGIFCGEKILSAFINHVDKTITYTLHVKDGQKIKNKDCLISFTGKSFSLLKLERPLLNLLQKLCGISTLTSTFVNALNDPKIEILDTRKTTPTLRHLEKYAVKIGGGQNHRHSLSDMVLIKENHLAALKKEDGLHTLDQKLKSFKKSNKDIPIEVEIESLEELTQLNLSEADYILLDNFKLEDISKAIKICKEKHYKAKLEVSGNISLETISQYKNSGIHRISIGKLTHSATALDLSMRIQL